MSPLSIGFTPPEPARVATGNQCPTPVAATIILATDTTLRCNVPGWDGENPSAIASDPVNGNVYVACSLTNDVAVIDAASKSIVSWIAVGESPEALALDAEAQRLYVAESGADSVAAIDLTTNSIIANYPAGIDPVSLAYDNVSRVLYVGGGLAGEGNITVLNASTGQPLASIVPWASYPRATPDEIALSPADDRLYVIYFGIQNVSYADLSTDELVGGFGFFYFPSAVMVDPITSLVYVVDSFYSWNVTSWSLTDLTQPTAYLQLPGYSSMTVASLLDLRTFNGDLLVSSRAGDRVVEVSSTLSSAISSPRFEAVSAMAYVSGTDEIFIAEPSFTNSDLRGSNSIVALNATGFATDAVLPLGIAPTALAVDPVDHRLFAYDGGTGNMTVIDTEDWTVTGTVNLGKVPLGQLAYDPIGGQIVLEVGGSRGLYTIRGSDLTVGFTNAPDLYWTAPPPSNMVYVPSVGRLVATEPAIRNLSVFTGGSLVWNQSGFEMPNSAAYDPSNGLVMITGIDWGWPSAGVTWFNASSFSRGPTLFLGGNPGPVAVDAANHSAVIADSTNGTTWLVDTQNGTYRAGPTVGGHPVAAAFGNGSFYVADRATDDVSIVSSTAPYDVISFAVGRLPDSVAYDPTSGTVFVANPGSGTISVITPRSLEPTYPVQLVAYGLPAGDVFQATVGAWTSSSNLPSLSFQLVNGTYSFSVAPVPNYRPVPPSGTIVVNGSLVQRAIQFVPSIPFEYPATFQQVGLPPDAGWGVFLDGVGYLALAGQAITVPAANGSHAFIIGQVPGYDSAPGSGSLQISGGGVVEPIVFTPVGPGAAFRVSIAEQGLPSGTLWPITVDAATYVGVGPNLTLWLANGTFLYEVGPVIGYRSFPATGSIVVAGQPLNVNVVFSSLAPVLYSVRFQETGLPAGVSWGVQLGTQSAGSVGSEISLTAPNGTYPFLVVGGAGFAANQTGGEIVVGGAAVTVYLTFSPSPSATSLGGDGFSSAIPWAAGIALGVLAGALGMALYERRRPRRESPRRPEDLHPPIEAGRDPPRPKVEPP